MADMFDEVDAAIQRDKAILWWQKNGNAVAAIMLAIVVGVGVNGWWQNHQRGSLEKQTAQLLDVLLPIQGEAIKPEQAEATLKNLQANGDKQLDVISALQLASQYEAAGKNAEAAATLKPLMTRRYTEKILQDLATVQYVRVSLANLETGEQHMTNKTELGLLSLIEPLTASNRPFRYSAKELQALVLLRDAATFKDEAKRKQADDIFKSLSDDQGAPATLRERAQAYLVTANSTH